MLKRPRLLFAGKLALTALLIYALVRFSGGLASVMEVLGRVEPGWIVLMLGMSLSKRVTEAYLMRCVLARVAAPVSTFRVFLANSLAVLYSLVAPGDVVSSIAKWHNLSLATKDKSIVLNAIVYNRLIIMIPAVLIGILAFQIFHADVAAGSLIYMALVPLSLAALALLMFSERFGWILDRVLLRLLGQLPARLSARLRAVIDAMTAFRRLTWLDHARFFAISWVGFIFGASVMAFAARSVGIELSPLVFLWVTGLIQIIRQLPITIGNLGVTEGVLVFALGLYGVAPDAAFAAGLVAFTAVLLTAAVGGAYQSALLLGLTTGHSR